MRFSIRSTALTCLCLAAATASQAQEAAPPAIDPNAFAHCLAGLRNSPAFANISNSTWQQHVATLTPDATVLPLLNRQPEFSMPAWDYLAVLVDKERVADGRAAYRQWLPVLRQIQQRYGVEPAVVLGVWGVESNFGRITGGRPLLQSLGTLSCFGRRQGYFRTEFASALRIVQEGSISADKLKGSWAGAFGQTQFMPSTFLRTAVDFDGDGRRDLIDNVPDALASTANFLRKAGYVSNQPWGYEVKLPAGFDASQAGRRNRRSVAPKGGFRPPATPSTKPDRAPSAAPPTACTSVMTSSRPATPERQIAVKAVAVSASEGNTNGPETRLSQAQPPANNSRPNPP